MAPERIDPAGDQANYDVKSDVWSFGISMIEIAEGKFPYQLWATPFEQLKQVGLIAWQCGTVLFIQKCFNDGSLLNSKLNIQVVMDPAPSLTPGQFSDSFNDFISIF